MLKISEKKKNTVNMQTLHIPKTNVAKSFSQACRWFLTLLRPCPLVSVFVWKRRIFFSCFQNYFRPHDNVFESLSHDWKTLTVYLGSNVIPSSTCTSWFNPKYLRSCLHLLSRCFRLAFKIGSESNRRLLSLLLTSSAWINIQQSLVDLKTRN